MGKPRADKSGNSWSLLTPGGTTTYSHLLWNEEQMRRFPRWLLSRRRAMWLEELEEGIRNRTVHRYARLLAGTGIGSKHRRFGQIRPTPLLRLNGHKVCQKKDQRVVLLCTNTRGTTSDESIWNYRTLVTVKRRRCIERRLEQIMLAL